MSNSSPFPISITKITPPTRKRGLVSRARLTDNIYSILTRKLILITAPAGYGKTSLLVDLIDKSEIPICWLSLDVMDQEPQRFISYFIASIRAKYPLFGSESSSALMNTVSIEKENERLIIAITNEIFKVIPEHFAIVLDDYQFIDSVPEIRNFINRFIQLAGEHCHLILLSRLLPAIPDLHLWVARDQVGGLSLEDLAFNPQEIQEFFAQNSRQTLTLDEAKEIALKSDGWITSIALTGLSYEDEAGKHRTSAAKTGIELYEYFTREILEKQSRGIREFLLLTSLFDDVNLDLCIEVLQPLFPDRQIDWQNHLQWVQNNNLFTVPMEISGSDFRYHHLFQEFLQFKLNEENPKIIPVVMSRLAAFYRERFDWEKAHHIYENLADMNGLVSLIEEAGTIFIQNGRIATLEKWLERLPLSILQQNAALLSLQGSVAYTQGHTQLGISLLSQAEVKFRENNDHKNLAGTLIRRAAAYRELGDFSHALADADETISLTKDDPEKELQNKFALALRVKGLVLFRIGKTSEAIPLLENALQLLTILKNDNQIPMVQMELGVVHHSLGNDDLTIKFFLNALNIWTGAGNLGWKATLMNNLAVLHHSRGEYEKAFQELEEAIYCAQQSGYIRAQALALSSLGDLLVDLREIDQAENCYDQASIMASQLEHSFLIFYTSIAKARIARLVHRLPAAEALLRELYENSSSDQPIADEALYRQEYGCFLLYSNKASEAINEFQKAIHLFEQDGRTPEACNSRLWLIAARISSGEKDPSQLQILDVSKDCKNLKEPFQVYATAAEILLWMESQNQPTSSLAGLQPIFTHASNFTRKIPSLRRRIRQISKSAFISPSKITIQAFGTAKVFVNGNLLKLSDWQTRETRDLFFFFLRKYPMTKEEISAVFWPDISPARLKMRFKTTLYRLRHAVGQDTILFDGERYQFNSEIDYEYDFERFHELTDHANKLKDAAEKTVQLQKAVDLVRGALMSDIDSQWSDDLRNEFGEKYQATLIKLAKLYYETNQPDKAIKLCKIILEKNRASEEGYRILMSAQAMLGDKIAIANAYKACSIVLFTEFGIAPSDETEKHYKKLFF